MECISATNLCRKSGQWGTQHLLTVWSPLESISDPVGPQKGFKPVLFSIGYGRATKHEFFFSMFSRAVTGLQRTWFFAVCGSLLGFYPLQLGHASGLIPIRHVDVGVLIDKTSVGRAEVGESDVARK